MALDLSSVATKTDSYAFEYDWQRVVLYALGVGATIDEIEYLYEARGPQVLPSFAVIPAIDPVVEALRRMQAPTAKILHGQQEIILHGPLPASGVLHSHAEIEGIYDKGSGALAVIRTFCTSRGEPVAETVWGIFVRGEGGFDGDRGPKAAVIEIPAREPEITREQMTSAEQAALYRLSGDLNPLHIDPTVAAAAGFEAPILHGLCTFGFVTRALVRDIAGGDPTQLRSLSARFSGVVHPGDSLQTRMWKAADDQYLLEVQSGRGHKVLSHAQARFGPHEH